MKDQISPKRLDNLYQKAYRPPLFFKNGHLQTIFPTLFRKFDTTFYTRERIKTHDDDFLDLDWSMIGSEQLAIVSHGLEGNSHRAYVVGMVKALNASGWDALAWNYRGCSGTVNRQLYSYHSGWTDDLVQVIQHAKESGIYKRIALIGFSIGGNITLVYLGKNRGAANGIVDKAVVFSVPCDLNASAKALEKSINKIYMLRFLIKLKNKVKEKMAIMPDKINDHPFKQIKTIKDFDDAYTAPINGFKNAEEYYATCSSRQYITGINIPTLLISAKNDPLLSKTCYPVDEAARNKHVTLEIPDYGGHTGFVEFNQDNIYWSEKRALMFLNEGPE